MRCHYCGGCRHNPDKTERKLERLYIAGDREAGLRLLQMQLQSGSISRQEYYGGLYKIGEIHVDELRNLVQKWRLARLEDYRHFRPLTFVGGVAIDQQAEDLECFDCCTLLDQHNCVDSRGDPKCLKCSNITIPAHVPGGNIPPPREKPWILRERCPHENIEFNSRWSEDAGGFIHGSEYRQICLDCNLTLALEVTSHTGDYDDSDVPDWWPH